MASASGALPQGPKADPRSFHWIFYDEDFDADDDDDEDEKDDDDVEDLDDAGGSLNQWMVNLYRKVSRSLSHWGF